MLVYTAITDKKDTLKEFEKEDGVEYVAYCDEDLKSDTWEVKKTGNWVADPYLNAKWYKILPHRNFKTDISLWIDGNISLKTPPTSLLKYLDGFDIALFKHNLRDCSYEEAVAVAKYGYDDVKKVEKQMVSYNKEGFPTKYGLTYNGFILRRHTPEVEKLNEFWWDQIINNSRRDQLSLMYSCWKLGIKPNIVDIGDVHHENPIYKREVHNYESRIA